MSDEGTQQRLGQHPCEGETLAKGQACQDLSSAADITSANPASAGAAGTGTGGTADLLDNVRAIFTTLRMTITQHDGIINAHNITGMENFYHIRVDDDGSFIKVWNDTSL